MTKPKPMPDAEVRVYTHNALRAVVQVQGTALSFADTLKVRCTIQEQQPDGSWRPAT